MGRGCIIILKKRHEKKPNPFSDAYPRYQNLDFLINSHLARQEWHGCDTRVVTYKAPFFYHINLCLSQHPASRILPSRNRQHVHCNSPSKNIPHILHETQSTNSQFAGISPRVSRQLQHRRLFLEFNGSQRWKTHTGQFSRKCSTTRLPVMSTQTALKLPGKLPMHGCQGCQHCQLQTLQK